MKYILLPIAEEKQCNEILADAISQGAERGLFMRASFGKDIYNHLQLLMDRGYFTAGIIIDSESQNVEFLFNRHNSQTNDMKMNEVVIDNPNKI